MNRQLPMHDLQLRCRLRREPYGLHLNSRLSWRILKE